MTHSLEYFVVKNVSQTVLNHENFSHKNNVNKLIYETNFLEAMTLALYRYSRTYSHTIEIHTN